MSICHDLKITDMQHNNNTDNNDNINRSNNNNKVNRLDLRLEKLGRIIRMGLLQKTRILRKMLEN